MKTGIRRHNNLLSGAIRCSVASSLSLLAAIMVNNEGKNKTELLIFGIVFWVMLIFEQVFFWRANKLMRSLIKKKNPLKNQRMGLLSVATCKEGMIVDLIFFISLVALIVCMIFGLGKSYLQSVLICLVVLAFRLHCFLNGRNYRYKKHQKGDCNDRSKN